MRGGKGTPEGERGMLVGGAQVPSEFGKAGGAEKPFGGARAPDVALTRN